MVCGFCNLDCRHAARSANQRHAASSHSCGGLGIPPGVRFSGGWYQTVTWAPSSTTRSDGIAKKSVAFAACRDRVIKSRSCHEGMPEFGAGLIDQRPRKNDVVMMSNFKPALRSEASAAGTRGLSM